MRPSVYDLRAYNLPPYLFRLFIRGLLTVVAYVVVDDVSGGWGRTFAWALAVLTVITFLRLLALPIRMQPRRLVIDDTGIRIEREPGRYEFRVRWGELSAVRLVVLAGPRRSLEKWLGRLLRRPVSQPWLGTVVVLEMVPVDGATRQRTRELDLAWRRGRSEAWWTTVINSPGEPPPIELALQRWCPEPLWQGQLGFRSA